MDVVRGSVFTVVYPFVRAANGGGEEELGAWVIGKWTPGTTGAAVGPEDYEDVAHGLGEMILTVVDVFHPKPFPPRVFLTRKFRDPDGKVFGKNKLHIWTREKFLRRARAFEYPFVLRAKS